MKKNKLNQFSQTHGAIITDELTDLDKINKKPSHQISLAAKYEDQLSEMDLDDLKELARQLNIIPLDNKDVLIKSIKKEFKKK